MQTAPLLLLSALLLAVPGAARAQARNARVSGSVVDKTSGSPVAGATVVFLGDGRAQTTDSAGSFRFDKLPMGIARFLVRANGFPAGALIVALAPGELLERRVELDSVTPERVVETAPRPTSANGQMLAPVTIEGERSLGPRFANFERRRRTGAGQYITREEIDQRQYSSLQDIARGMRGVNVECSGGSQGCQIRMVRAPMRCLPQYIIDDNLDNIFGPTMPVRDIEGMEVYTGPADVPGEYAGRNAGCGVIVIWTRSGPPRKKKEK
ncbi:MAG: carboxypeptidase regulatory-like domain-containing protein [Gemmatimonadaceae bacterium]|nr:carboxypeptidase regulatory-like domain-containing protein [Gemmatimonadaceae bacterium]